MRRELLIQTTVQEMVHGSKYYLYIDEPFQTIIHLTFDQYDQRYNTAYFNETFVYMPENAKFFIPEEPKS